MHHILLKHFALSPKFKQKFEGGNYEEEANNNSNNSYRFGSSITVPY